MHFLQPLSWNPVQPFSNCKHMSVVDLLKQLLKIESQHTFFSFTYVVIMKWEKRKKNREFGTFLVLHSLNKRSRQAWQAPKWKLIYGIPNGLSRTFFDYTRILCFRFSLVVGLFRSTLSLSYVQRNQSNCVKSGILVATQLYQTSVRQILYRDILWQ